MGSALDLPVRSVTLEEGMAKLGFFARFISAENRSSSGKAMKELGWEVREPEIFEDIRTGSYQAVAKELRKSGA